MNEYIQFTPFICFSSLIVTLVSAQVILYDYLIFEIVTCLISGKNATLWYIVNPVSTRIVAHALLLRYYCS